MRQQPPERLARAVATPSMADPPDDRLDDIFPMDGEPIGGG